MPTLIDGYNLMHAGGLLGKKLGSDQFRKIRTRFLTDLAHALGPIRAHDTTIVFDASNPPYDLPEKSRHKGLTVLYAINDENADARLEQLIAEHSAPKRLRVVSSDRRVRLAAKRRRAISVSADEFWVEIDRLKAAPRRYKNAENTAPAPKAKPPRDPRLTDGEIAFWAEEFQDLDAMPETQEALGDGPSMLTDADIARIEREIEDEFK